MYAIFYSSGTSAVGNVRQVNRYHLQYLIIFLALQFGKISMQIQI